MDLYKQFYGVSGECFKEKTCEHTAYEIAHQPIMWRRLGEYLKKMKPEIFGFMGKMGNLKNMRIILTGAGSSGFAGRAVAGYLAKAAGINCDAIHTTDIVSAPDVYLFADTPTLLVSFGRSGNSPESVGAVEYARKIVKNLYELAIVCDGTSRLSAITRESENGLLLVMPEGTNDKGFAMTSSVSTMIMAGFAALSGYDIQKISGDMDLLADQIETKGPDMVRAAKTCAEWGFDRAWYIGSGTHTALSQEGALKIMELTNGAVVAGHNNSAEFRHGPKTVLSPKAVTIHFISNNDFTARYDMDLLKELYSQRDGNKVVAIHNEDAAVEADLAVPYKAFGHEAFADVVTDMQGLVFMQLMAMYASLAIGVPTDNPSPSGLVNRVVQGVTVYQI